MVENDHKPRNGDSMDIHKFHDRLMLAEKCCALCLFLLYAHWVSRMFIRDKFFIISGCYEAENSCFVQMYTLQFRVIIILQESPNKCTIKVSRILLWNFNFYVRESKSHHQRGIHGDDEDIKLESWNDLMRITLSKLSMPLGC
jgi:hypothetical protein